MNESLFDGFDDLNFGSRDRVDLHSSRDLVQTEERRTNKGKEGKGSDGKGNQLDSTWMERGGSVGTDSAFFFGRRAPLYSMVTIGEDMLGESRIGWDGWMDVVGGESTPIELRL